LLFYLIKKETTKMSESMNDYLDELEKSYSYMGDGVHNTDELLVWNKAKELLESKEAVTLTITEIKKGGVIVDFEGVNGFIPISRISNDRVENLKPYLYQEITVQVIEVNMEEDKLVFSAKELLKAKEAEENRKKAQAVTPGMILEGTVESLKEYGAFIRLENGLSGLVHISQISEKRIKHPGVALKLGQDVNVKVLEIKDGKISLSIKALNESSEEEEETEAIKLPESESIGTSMASLLSGFKFS